MSKVIVEVKRNDNENSISLIRRFTKRMQGSGALRRVRSLRWATRKSSPFKAKKSALVVLSRRREYELLKKLGKLPKEEKRRGR